MEAAAANSRLSISTSRPATSRARSIVPELMASRVVLVAALVLFAAVAVAHAARVLEYQPTDAGFGEGPPGQLPAEAVSPSSGHIATAPPAVPGGGRDADGGSSAIADILWLVLRWANEAPAGDRRKEY